MPLYEVLAPGWLSWPSQEPDGRRQETPTGSGWCRPGPDKTKHFQFLLQNPFDVNTSKVWNWVLHPLNCFSLHSCKVPRAASDTCIQYDISISTASCKKNDLYIFMNMICTFPFPMRIAKKRFTRSELAFLFWPGALHNEYCTSLDGCLCFYVSMFAMFAMTHSMRAGLSFLTWFSA